jgi:hypothetical protein
MTIDDIINRLSLGILVLIPACLIVSCILMLGGEYVGTAMIIGPVVIGAAYMIGDLAVSLLSPNAE